MDFVYSYPMTLLRARNCLELRKKLIMSLKKTSQGDRYHIKIDGFLNLKSFEWMKDAQIISQENNETIISVELIDQSALRGFIDQLWNFNFTILSVEKMEKQ